MGKSIRIIGIDPGLRNMGWGIIEVYGSKLSFIACGTLHSDNSSALAERLQQLFLGLTDIFKQFCPQEAAVEQTFVNKDAVATLKLGQARSVALLVPALQNVAVAEYAPNKVKKAVIGVGHGDKAQIQMMVKMLIPAAKFKTPDAADALAIAICHAHSRVANKRLAALR
ncbi:crossover junction endodeoxyribonuclease RuvC [Bartonella sp. TP]|uniref:crossover junction endodeoxyribonuclease RuvC n=1 Tax=Bartonella sp. TP TaxID=3057550 RepID=UPI0025B27FE3|nr:crossover junction endodeoxyribonuclease RuvC [Bartonella sp. TP]MDN5248716.1 crossover junction endodeoxyribonuclease RuvC [Alphaproteobacteria bacterium]WJW80537.1 crossover junction endodeoxyribonuclease RuvC [Bartonella sp. TP]